jgi:GNAT superfamily N-acetyltransferase
VHDGIRISDDDADLDRDRILRWITRESYWATGLPAERQEAALAGSWNFGAYDEATGEQLGFARLVTDRATFAWLCDVYVDNAARGRGVGKRLVAAITAAVDELGIRRLILATADAHGLYRQYGFEPLAAPHKWMARIAPAGS